VITCPSDDTKNYFIHPLHHFL